MAFRKSPQANPVLMAVERHSLALQGFIKPSDEQFLDLSLCILPKLKPGSDVPSIRHKDFKILTALSDIQGWERLPVLFRALEEASSSLEESF